MKFKGLLFVAVLASAAAGYVYLTGAHTFIQKKNSEPVYIPDSAITFPLDPKQVSKTEFGMLVKEVLSHKETAALLQGTTLPVDGAGKISKLHPRTYELYERCMSLIASDPKWSEFYSFALGHEILGLNSRLTNLSGLIDSHAEKFGRDFVYQIADNDMKYLMEGINKNGAEIMLELLQKPESNPEFRAKSEDAIKIIYGEKTVSTINKEEAGYILGFMCGSVDVNLGLMGLGTNFQNRVANIADIVRMRVKHVNAEKSEQRREQLNKALEVLKQ